MTSLFRKMSSSAGAIAARLAPRQFARREEGTVTAFAAMIFVLMVGISGIAIDIMRYETQRTQLQYTLDRAILAAASLTQPYDPEGVVRNYFEVAGIEDYRLDVRVEEGVNFRRVHAYAELEVRSLFMHLFGVRVMSTPAIGAAEERVRNIEVSMVLDISGSMGSNSRMTNMRPAAREFVTELLQANNNINNEMLVSVSIVPYNGMVNAGDIIESVFTFDATHDQSSCARFSPVISSYFYDVATMGPWDANFWPPSSYTSTAIDPTQPIQRISHWDRANEDDDELFDDSYCRTDNYGAILPWQHNETALHDHIDALSTGGWTAIDVGMNWGVALLDPAAAPAVADLVAANIVHSDFSQRPAPYIDGNPVTLLDDETIKVVVLMTDGANTNQYDLREVWEHNGAYYYDGSTPPNDARYIGFNSGRAPIFRHAGVDGVLSEGEIDNGRWDFGDDRFSIWWEDRGLDGEFWIPVSEPYDPRGPGGTWSSVPEGGWAAYGLANPDGTPISDWQDRRANAYDPDRDNDGLPDGYDGTVMPWSGLFANVTAGYIAAEWLAAPANESGNWDFHNLVATNASYLFAARNEADDNLRAICDAANAAGIVVFTIGFEAPTGGQEVMHYCASTDAQYFAVVGAEISLAFASIAQTINQLRLIQ